MLGVHVCVFGSTSPLGIEEASGLCSDEKGKATSSHA